MLANTDTMARKVQVPDAVFAQVAALYPPVQVVEITATAGGPQHGRAPARGAAEPLARRPLTARCPRFSFQYRGHPMKNKATLVVELLLPLAAIARDAWPSRPITFVVPFRPAVRAT